MKAKRKSAPDTSIRQAELILQLYEVRREAVMREARSYIGGAFLPASADETFLRYHWRQGKVYFPSW